MTLSIAKTKSFIRYVVACLSAVAFSVLFGVSSPAHAALGTWPLTGADQHVAATTRLISFGTTWYCPATLTAQTASYTGGGVSASLDFNVANALSAFAGSQTNPLALLR
ncbi:MAG TPA: hypothetical protein VGG24_16195 [Paraburkholderia sp.]|jgi:hypothetical protein